MENNMNMENNMIIKTNEMFGDLRVVMMDNEPWFVGKDIAEKLGYKNTKKAILDHVDEEDKMKNDGVTIWDSIGRKQNPVVINESGLYSLILKSKLPEAKQFRRWVTKEVLPSIRKDGGYIATNSDMSDEEIMAKALMVAQKTIERKNLELQEHKRIIEEQKPKVVFADSVSNSNDLILVRDLAKIISQNGVAIGEKKLYAWLRDNDYLIKQKGSSYNTPKQQYIKSGLFKVVERVITNPVGDNKISITTKITPKGQQYFVNKFLK